MNRLDGKCPYILLQVKSSADDAAINRAFKRSALRHHPDKHRNATEQTQKRHETAFKLLAAARDVLLNDEIRDQYDRISGRCPRCPYNEKSSTNIGKCAKCTPVALDPHVLVFSQHPVTDEAQYSVAMRLKDLNTEVEAHDLMLDELREDARGLKRKRDNIDSKISEIEKKLAAGTKRRNKAYAEYHTIAAAVYAGKV